MAKKQPSALAGKLRIIGGKWRSRILPVVDLPGLRPTTSRVRETLFNWLQNDVPGANCLDLFAGSGALGFESASRGAASVMMLETQRQAVKILTENVQTLGVPAIEILQQDAMSWLASSASTQYDVVFLDPPFASDYLPKACELLESQQHLSAHACIYLEMDRKHDLPELPENWSVVKEKKAGQVNYYLVRRNVNTL